MNRIEEASASSFCPSLFLSILFIDPHYLSGGSLYLL
nr:MAG TPA: hypothetical protein [Caudoviricetes sp.]